MPQLAAGAADSGAPAVSSALLAGAVGGGLLGLVLLVTIAVIVRALFRRLSGFKLPLTLKPVVYALDLFSPMRPINVGSDRVLAERDKSTLGFSMTLLAVGTLGVLAAVLGASRANANTLVQQSLGPLEGPLLEATAGWPFATAPVPGLPGEANGLFLRFTASGEPRACLPLAGSLQFSGLKAGAWALLPPPACAGGACRFPAADSAAYSSAITFTLLQSTTMAQRPHCDAASAAKRGRSSASTAAPSPAAERSASHRSAHAAPASLSAASCSHEGRPTLLQPRR
jgi:hypothetical protein